jgi:hypothetical protein
MSDPKNPVEDAVEGFEEFGGESLWEGVTRCPEGCCVEPDGTCPHGYNSVMLNAGLV